MQKALSFLIWLWTGYGILVILMSAFRLQESLPWAPVALNWLKDLGQLIGLPNAGAAWNLRCEVREKLMEFIQTQQPQSLPYFRTELTGKGLVKKEESPLK